MSTHRGSHQDDVEGLPTRLADLALDSRLEQLERNVNALRRDVVVVAAVLCNRGVVTLDEKRALEEVAHPAHYFEGSISDAQWDITRRDLPPPGWKLVERAQRNPDPTL